MRVVVLLFIAFIVMAEERTVLIRPSSNEVQQYYPGDVVKMDIVLSPKNLFPIEIINQLQNKELIPGLFFTDLETVKVSENNSDVIFSQLFTVVKNNYQEQAVGTFKLGKNQVKYRLLDFKFGFREVEKKDEFIVFNQSPISESKLKPWHFIFGLVIAMILGIFLYRYRSKQRQILAKKQEEEKRYNKWKDHFLKAERRKDFEIIANDKEEWEKYLDHLKVEKKLFLNAVDKYQYQKNWSEEETQEVIHKFKKLKEEFINHGI